MTDPPAPPSSPPDRGGDVRALSGAERGTGADLHALCARLYPFLRSITGEGVRETLAVIGRAHPAHRHRSAFGQRRRSTGRCRPEWTVREAWIKDPTASVDRATLRDHNLHLVNYSAPFRGRLPLAELRPRLFSLPDRPDWIPYRTSSTSRRTGASACRHRSLESLPDGDYEVCVDTTLAPGLAHLRRMRPAGTEPTDEVLVSAHVCHPSLANDNLSGIAVATFSRRALAGIDRHYTYRFVFAPSTIGVITWLAQREEVTSPHPPRPGAVRGGRSGRLQLQAQPSR